MTSWATGVFFALFTLAPAFAAEPPIVVGAVISQSGMLADLADGYRKGLLAWQDEVNAAGVYFVLPGQEPLAVPVGEVGEHPGLRNHRSHHDGGLGRERRREDEQREENSSHPAGHLPLRGRP